MHFPKEIPKFHYYYCDCESLTFVFLQLIKDTFGGFGGGHCVPKAVACYNEKVFGALHFHGSHIRIRANILLVLPIACKLERLRD